MLIITTGQRRNHSGNSVLTVTKIPRREASGM